jgi:hypothetical protein
MKHEAPTAAKLGRVEKLTLGSIIHWTYDDANGKRKIIWPF